MDLSAVAALIDSGIADGAFPGAVWGYAVGEKSEIVAQGRFAYCPESPAMVKNAIFDLASVSKVVATTSATMRLVDAGQLDLDQPVATVLPSFAQAGKERLTYRNLLVHNSGLIAFRPYHKSCTEPQEVFDKIDAEGFTYPTGTKTVYSDLNMIVLARAIEVLSGRSLDRFVHEEIFLPLGLHDTGYFRAVPPAGVRSLDPNRCVPTERSEDWRKPLREARAALLKDAPKVNPTWPDQGTYLQGEVHDPTAVVLGGVAGHAGLFSTAADLLRFGQALLGGRVATADTVAKFTRRQSEASSRALGWDTRSEGSSSGQHFGPRAFGHTGYTGTSLWIDPERGWIAVLLTNRVHPTSENTRILGFRPRFHDALADVLQRV